MCNDKNMQYTLVISFNDKTYWINKYGLLTRAYDHKYEVSRWMQLQKFYYKYFRAYKNKIHIIDDNGVIIK